MKLHALTWSAEQDATLKILMNIWQQHSAENVSSHRGSYIALHHAHRYDKSILIFKNSVNENKIKTLSALTLRVKHILSLIWHCWLYILPRKWSNEFDFLHVQPQSRRQSKKLCLLYAGLNTWHTMDAPLTQRECAFLVGRCCGNRKQIYGCELGDNLIPNVMAWEECCVCLVRAFNSTLPATPERPLSASRSPVCVWAWATKALNVREDRGFT